MMDQLVQAAPSVATRRRPSLPVEGTHRASCVGRAERALSAVLGPIAPSAVPIPVAAGAVALSSAFAVGEAPRLRNFEPGRTRA